MLTVVLGAHFPMGSLNPTRAMDLSYQKGGGTVVGQGVGE